LKEIIGKKNVLEAYGSLSRKNRYYADGHMVLRADEDSISKPPEFFDTHIEMVMGLKDVTAVIVSDYGKGALCESLAQKIIAGGKPVFVDAKHSWQWYQGAFCAFPNKFEGIGTGKRLESSNLFSHIVRKNSSAGCIVDGEEVAAYRAGELRDGTGAGDNFLAAFVASYLRTENLKVAARFANMVAGISVTHIGTHVVRPNEIPVPPAPSQPQPQAVIEHEPEVRPARRDHGSDVIAAQVD
jgi:bifunctional ADP-heptose synthase (sugar kinase/adenylyltransferase)